MRTKEFILLLMCAFPVHGTDRTLMCAAMFGAQRAESPPVASHVPDMFEEDPRGARGSIVHGAAASGAGSDGRAEILEDSGGGGGGGGASSSSEAVPATRLDPVPNDRECVSIYVALSRDVHTQFEVTLADAYGAASGGSTIETKGEDLRDCLAREDALVTRVDFYCDDPYALNIDRVRAILEGCSPKYVYFKWNAPLPRLDGVFPAMSTVEALRFSNLSLDNARHLAYALSESTLPKVESIKIDYMSDASEGIYGIVGVLPRAGHVRTLRFPPFDDSVGLERMLERVFPGGWGADSSFLDSARTLIRFGDNETLQEFGVGMEEETCAIM